jgi:prepilin-type N-terminal cleavage/methylation domain-containing protein
MRSTDPARRHRAQRGFSLVESLVASALLGIGVVAGLTAWDLATLSGENALRHAFGQCIVRSQLDAVLAMQWDSEGQYPKPSFPAAQLVRLDMQVDPARRDPISRAVVEQRVTVVARDLRVGSVLAQDSVLKASALGGSKALTDAGVPSDVVAGCPDP